MIARSIRNNNPLNIRRTKKCQWKGLAMRQTDTAFCQFETLEWGWRAALYLLTRTYYERYGLQTIRSIITRWAPPQDHNNTAAYILNVSRLTQIDANEPLGPPAEHPARWQMVAAAMAIQASGSASAVDWFAMMRGWELCSAMA